LTSFKPSIVFGGSWGSTENWLKPKTEPPLGYFSLPKSVKRSVLNTLNHSLTITFYYRHTHEQKHSPPGPPSKNTHHNTYTISQFIYLFKTYTKRHTYSFRNKHTHILSLSLNLSFTHNLYSLFLPFYHSLTLTFTTTHLL
jgi:hypothetical protein